MESNTTLTLPTVEPASNFQISERPSVRLSSHLLEALARVQNFVNEWTPLILITSYFIFSTCLYLICSPELITIFWFIYLVSNFYIAGSTVIEAVMSSTSYFILDTLSF